MPDAWTVNVPIDWSPSSLSKYLETILRRVKDSPLRLVVRDGRRSVKAEFLSAFSNALRNAKVKKVESLSFFFCRADMAYFPQLFMDLLPAAPRSLTIQALPSLHARGVTKRMKGSLLKAFFIPAGSILMAIESIQVVDVMLGIDFNGQNKSTMALRSLRIQQSGDESGQRLRCGLLSNAFLLKCAHLETFVFHGRFLHQHPAVGTPTVSPLRELYMAEFDLVIILRSLSVDMSFPNLTRFGTAMYSSSALVQFLSTTPSISDLSLPWVDSRIASPLPQITKLTVSSNGLYALYSLPQDGVCIFTRLEELIIDCRLAEVSQEVLETLIDVRVVHATANGYERPLSSVSLWRSSKSEKTVPETWMSTQEENDHLSKVFLPLAWNALL